MDTLIIAIAFISLVSSIVGAMKKKVPAPDENNNDGKNKNIGRPFSDQQNRMHQTDKKPGDADIKREASACPFGKVQQKDGSSEGLSNYPEMVKEVIEEDSPIYIASEELLSHRNLVEGVILSEILGKPKYMR